MTALAIILLIIFFFTGWILLVPLVIDVDTNRTVYRVYQAGIFRFCLGKDFQPQLHVLGIAVPLKQKKRLKADVKQGKKSKVSSKISIYQIIVLVKKIFQSIHIKRFHVDIDTDDVVMNAKLIPAFLLLSRGPVRLSANFEGRVCASFLAEVSVYRLVWAFLNFSLKNKYHGNEF